MLGKKAPKLTEREWQAVGPHAGWLAFVLVAGILGGLGSLLFLYAVGTPIMIVAYDIALKTAMVSPIVSLVFMLFLMAVTAVVSYVFTGEMVGWAFQLGIKWMGDRGVPASAIKKMEAALEQD
jgi:ABC-type multidrug transport system fused ATPase/permease subunit